jgi:hypothetical protein
MHDDDDDPLSLLESLGFCAMVLSTVIWVWVLVSLLFYFV